MPTTIEVRRLGPGWRTLQAQVAAYAAALPPEGVPLATFEADCLSAIFIPDRPAIISALKAKRLIFSVRTGPDVQVFRERQAGGGVRAAGDPAVDQFIRGVAPRMMRLAEVVDGVGPSPDRAARLRIAEAVRQVATLARRHIEGGLSLADARAALWRTFNAEAVKALASRESVFAERSTAETIAERKVKPKKAPSGQSLPDRIALLVERQGSAGIARSNVRDLLPKPRPSAAEIAEAVDALAQRGLLQTATGKATPQGREGLRLFGPTVRIPPKIKGRFLFAPA